METNELIPQDLPKVKTTTLGIVAVVIVVAFAGFFVLGFWPRHERIKEREAMAREIQDQRPVVQVVQPQATGTAVELTLPADVRAYAATALYARINGYLAFWKVDINDHVKKGDLLAVISAPDTDADLTQAEANLEQAKANVNQQQTNYELADATYQRYKGLIATHGVTQQQLDQYRSAMEQAKATLIAAKANVESAAAATDRLRTLTNFEKVIAPFDGVITARTYDPGALISTSNIGPGQELFDLAEDDWLRVFVNVPQAYSTLITFDQPVMLVLERNYPGHRFTGWVKRSTSVLDPITRTLRTELDFKNDDPTYRIFPGMYGQAIFSIKRAPPVLTIPTSAMLFEADGKQVAVVGRDSKIHFQKVTPGSDFGTAIEVLSGLQGDEQIVSNPGEKLAEGVEVSVASADNGHPAPESGTGSGSTPPAVPGEHLAQRDPVAHDPPSGE
jgi:RND family efflux transporter MFP subunit